jgi:hypothetical protein
VELVSHHSCFDFAHTKGLLRAGAAISESGQGYYYGGYLNNQTNPLWNGPQIATSNLIIFDMDQNSLTNNTGYDSMGRAEGTMVHIPAGGAGLLIYFGGATFPYENETAVGVSCALYSTSNSGLSLRISQAELDTILIYDIGDGKSISYHFPWLWANLVSPAKWYTQIATGEILEMRRKSCGGATWTEDHSSYQV